MSDGADLVPSRWLPHGPARRRNIVYWAIAVAAALPVLIATDRGFDPRDEAFYLDWIIDPAGYDATIHVFGPPLHLLYLAVGRSLVLMRIAGLLALMGSAAVLGRALRRHYRHAVGFDMVELTPLSALFALCYFSFWILTPSYNLLATCGVSLALAGLLGWFEESRAARRRDLGCSLAIGVGAAVTFFGKPTVAALIAVAAAGCWTVSLQTGSWRRAAERGAAVGGACLSTLALAILPVMPLAKFLNDLRTGQQALDIGNSVWALPAKTVREIADASPLFWLSAGVLALTLLLGPVLGGPASGGDGRALRRLRLTAAGLTALNVLTLVGGAALGVVGRGSPYTAMTIAVPTLAGAMSVAGWCAAMTPLDATRRSRRVLVPLLALLALPAVIAFGTINNILVQMQVSAAFVLLFATIAAALFAPPRAATRVRGAAMAYAVAIVAWSAAIPFYYNAPAIAQRVPVRLWFTPDTLYVDAPTAAYLNRVRQAAATQTGRRIVAIDLSGLGPGTVLAMHARAPFYPWLAPGFPGVAARADLAWRSLSAAERAGAWIIGPVHRELAGTLAARALRTPGGYVLVDRIPAVYWQQRQSIDIWRPSGAGPGGDSADRPTKGATVH